MFHTIDLPSFVSCLEWTRGSEAPPDPDCYMRDGNGDVQQSFYEDIIRLDMMKLRPLFREHLARKCPAWNYDSRDLRARKQHDFVQAVKLVSTGRHFRPIGRWLDALEQMLEEEDEEEGIMSIKYIPFEEFA